MLEVREAVNSAAIITRGHHHHHHNYHNHNHKHKLSKAYQEKPAGGHNKMGRGGYKRSNGRDGRYRRSSRSRQMSTESELGTGIHDIRDISDTRDSDITNLKRNIPEIIGANNRAQSQPPAVHIDIDESDDEDNDNHGNEDEKGMHRVHGKSISRSRKGLGLSLKSKSQKIDETETKQKVHKVTMFVIIWK